MAPSAYLLANPEVHNMYRATFTCHDRNGDDGIYSTHDGSIGETWHHTIADAICAIMADAEAHRDMYADTAEHHWRDAFATAADAFATMLHDGTTRRPIESLTYLISGDHDPADHAPWTLGTYTITTGRPTCAECRTTLTGYTIPNGSNSDSITCHACGLDADPARHYAAHPTT
jgi:hypothetical protein